MSVTPDIRAGRVKIARLIQRSTYFPLYHARCLIIWYNGIKGYAD